jgi:hypothetical protein
MKTLISIILLIVMAISITGCTVVRERHYGRAHHEVIVTHEHHRDVRPIPPRRPGPPQRRPGRPAPSRRGD